MKIKRKMKPVVIANITVSSGNDCDVYMFPIRADLAPVRLKWEIYPPSRQDIEECEIEVRLLHERLFGVLTASTEHFIGGSEGEFEARVEREVQAHNAHNN